MRFGRGRDVTISPSSAPQRFVCILPDEEPEMSMHASDYRSRPFPCPPALDEHLARIHNAEIASARGRAKTLPVVPGHLRLVTVEDEETVSAAPAAGEIRVLGPRLRATTAAAVNGGDLAAEEMAEQPATEVVTTPVASISRMPRAGHLQQRGAKSDPMLKNWFILGCMA